MTIRKLLVANRAEIAARIFRTARSMDIATVAVFSDPDAGLPYVRQAGQSVRLHGATPGDTYLDGAAIIAAARATGADAVHPGYGFLSENAEFAAACGAAGLTFVGPRPDAMAAMGSKIAARELMAGAGVPVLPAVTVPGTTVPATTGLPAPRAEGARGAGLGPGSHPADPSYPDALAAAVAEIGYPVLVKAAYGGGGRGMRRVTDPSGLPEAIASARREAESAFGNGALFIERFIDNPRHVEVQILGDHEGTVVSLFERECSIQRRYQKIIEEAPSPAIDDKQRKELCEAAVAAGQAIGYIGAGTVEFVLDPAGQFYFLEVNTRLQVEHPVTELVTGLDLVELQLRIAGGEPVPDDVREAEIAGHAIEARLYAEDTARGYLPASGTIHSLDIPAGAEAGDGCIRVDAGYAAGADVSIYYDSMLAKVIAWGPDRDAARRALAGTLARATIHGVVTNRDLLVAVLRSDEFAAAAIDTGFLTRHPAESLVPDDGPPPEHLLAAVLAGQAERRMHTPVLRTFPSGWRNNPSALQYATFAGRTVGYRLSGRSVCASLDGEQLPAALAHAITPAEVDLELGGIRRVIAVHRVGDVTYVDSDLGHSALTETPRFGEHAAGLAAGSLVAPMPGTVIRVQAAVGDRLERGQAIVAIEAMKMEHVVAAPAAGRLAAVHVAVGDQVAAGLVVALVDEGV
jgi:acyl-CoA carboxylase subunit alpha